MLTLKPQGKIVERTVKTKTGQLVCAVFLVVLRDGELDVRLISVRPIPKTERFRIQDSRFKNGTLCLRGSCAKSSAVTSKRHKYTAVVSPFFNIFELLTPIKIRAPSR